jgi:voltage-gated sodium channel
MFTLFKQLAAADAFNQFIIGVIIVAAALVGLQTSSEIMAGYGYYIDLADDIILWIFVIEIIIKIGSEGYQPQRYFQQAWNVFDFTIVLFCFLSVGSQFVAVLRLARVLRILRLISRLPRLQLLVAALFKSIPSMGYIIIFLVLLFYIYAVMGTFLFSKNDPIHFGTLALSMLSLFRTVTLESWTELLYIQMYGCDQVGYDNVFKSQCTNPEAQPLIAAIYFVSFILIGSMIVINLFIGVVMNSIQETQAESELEILTRRKKIQGQLTADEELRLVREKLQLIQQELTILSNRLKANDTEKKVGIPPGYQYHLQQPTNTNKDGSKKQH